jgi:hypothetical protein
MSNLWAVRNEYVSYLPHITGSHVTALDGDCSRSICRDHCESYWTMASVWVFDLEFTYLGSAFCALIHNVFDEHVFLFRCLQVHTPVNYAHYVYKTTPVSN